MTTHLHMLPPSVNSLAVRVFLRAGDLPFTEENAWGKTRTPEFMTKVPSHLTPAIEASDLPRGAMWESCAIMMYLANKHGLGALYPADPGKRALVDSANFYLMGTLYPLVARAAYPRLGFGGAPGEVSASKDATDQQKEAARKAAEEAIAEPLEVFHKYFVRDGFIGDGAVPSLADIRLAATLEFIAVTDLALPAWAKEYLARVEAKLGKAYSEPAADVRGFLASVQKKSS
ncbi:MAG: glutathione S-transferase family protein [Polyangiaceae bacterium]|jgi:glutathione S-transferase|nr:glutathione S-transferase family protein [Polyangiaceae bacterium]MBK8942867.1 glutathione S-transferase family protein [Polyangiaceae bacterium]